MLDRLMGVIMLKAPVYKEIAEDKSATTMAAVWVIIGTLISGFFGGLVTVDVQSGGSSINIVGAILGAILAVIFGLLGWLVSSWVAALVAKALGGKTDTGEMLRVGGFVHVFDLVSIVNILSIVPPLACIAGIISFVVAILRIIGTVIGIREAAEFSTVNAIITAVIVGIVFFIIAAVIGGGIAAAIVLAMAVAGR